LKLNLETELRRNVFGASDERYRLFKGKINKIAIITHIEDHFAKTEFKLKNQRLSRVCIAHLRRCFLKLEYVSQSSR
jgi:hypothetical protein